MNEPDCPTCQTALFVRRHWHGDKWHCVSCERDIPDAAVDTREEHRPEVPWR